HPTRSAAASYPPTLRGTPWPRLRNRRAYIGLWMYEQIAQNKRRAVLLALVFFVVWVGIGALIGWIAAALSASPDSTTNYAGPVIAGAVIAGIVALLAIAYSVSAGARLVLAVSGAHPADPVQHPQLHNLVEELAIC